MRKILPVFLTIVILFLIAKFSASSYADSNSGSANGLSLPPTSEGPGIFLPDSPFFFLDQLKQNIRLAFAVTPLQKAKVYELVAGERIAELRFELAKNNIPSAQAAMLGIRANTALAVNEVESAKLWGEDVSNIAREINLSIKDHLQSLSILESQSTGELQAETTVAIASLMDSKKRIEKFLPNADMENELRDDLKIQTIRSAQNMTSSAKSLQGSLIELQKQATIAASNETGSKKEKKAKEKQEIQSLLQEQSVAQSEDILNKAQDLLDKLKMALNTNSTESGASVNK